MRIIKNNVGEENNSVSVEPPDFPREETCKYCDSVIELEKKDTYIGQYGCVKWDCPCCGKPNTIDDLDGEELTPSYFHYPQHFSRYGDDDCVHQTDEQIEEHVKKLIKLIRKDRKNDINDAIQYLATSDTLILVDDYGGEYGVIVAKNYQDTYLKYEDEDYA